MRLKKRKINKQAVALAIAASVAVSVPMSANAIAYDIDGGTVHVDKDSDEHTVSWQDKSEKYNSKDNSYDHDEHNDNEIKIVDEITDTDDEEAKDKEPVKDGTGNIKDDYASNDSTGNTIYDVSDNAKDYTIVKDESNNVDIVNKDTIVDVKGSDWDYEKGDDNQTVKDYTVDVNGEKKELEITIDLDNNNAEDDTDAYIVQGDSHDDILYKDGNAEQTTNNGTTRDMHLCDTIANIEGMTEDSAISIGDNVTGLNVAVEDSKIGINAENEAVIDIGKGSEVDLTLKNSKLIVAKTAKDDDDDDDDRKEKRSTDKNDETIRNGQTGIRTLVKSDVKVTVEGDNTIAAGDELTMDNIGGSSSRNINGIAVGGWGADGAGGDSDSEDYSSGHATMTIEGSTDNGTAPSLTIDGVADGIKVHKNGVLNANGGTKGEEDEAKADAVALKLNIKNIKQTNVNSVTARGIWNVGGYADGDTTMMGVNLRDHIQLMLENIPYWGIDLWGGTGLLAEDGADIRLNNVGVELRGGGILLESNTNLTIKDKGTTLTSLQTGEQGVIKAEGTNNTITFSDGAKANMSNAIYNDDGEIVDATEATAIELIGKNSKLIVENKDTEVNIEEFGNGKMSGLIYLSSNASIDVLDNGKIALGHSEFYKAKNDSDKWLEGWRANAIHMNGSGNSITVDNGWISIAKSRIVFNGSNQTILITNGGKVETDNIITFAKDYKFYVTGGTLTLTGVDKEKDLYTGSPQLGDTLDSSYMTTLYSGQDKEHTNIAWPTNTDANGNEKLVNFRLSRDDIESIVSSFSSLSDEEQEEIDIKDGKLYLTAYGHKDGEADNVFQKYTYVVDLSKYESGETLDIWVPAVILDYYYPINDRSEGNVSLDELKKKYLDGNNEKTLQTDTLNAKDKYTVTDGKVYDAIIRGHSIKLNTLNGDYTTGIMDSSRQDQTWYYWDSVEEKWEEFTALTPIKSYSLGEDPDNAKPIVGLHTHFWDENKLKKLTDPDCRYHGTGIEYCSDGACTAHSGTIILDDELKPHSWYSADGIESSLTKTEDKWVDANNNKLDIYQDENGNKYYFEQKADGTYNVWQITQAPDGENSGTARLHCTVYPGTDGLGEDKVNPATEATAGETNHYQTMTIKVAPTEPTDPIIPKPDKKPDDNNDNNDKKNTDDSVPVVPAIVPVTPETPAVTPEAPVVTPETPVAEPVAETPAIPAPAETAPAAPATNKLPQTGAALFESIGLAAAGLALSLGSLFGKGKHGKK